MSNIELDPSKQPTVLTGESGQITQDFSHSGHVSAFQQYHLNRCPITTYELMVLDMTRCN